MSSPVTTRTKATKSSGDEPKKMSGDKIHLMPTVVRVSRSVKVDGQDQAQESDDEEIIEVHRFVTQPAVIPFRYEVKRSKDFQSVGISVGVELPCYVEEIPEGMDRAQEIVVERLRQEMPKLGKVLDKLISLR